jgi:hypothetical protein
VADQHRQPTRGRVNRATWCPIDDPGQRELVKDLWFVFRRAQAGDIDGALLGVLGLHMKYKPHAPLDDLERAAPAWKAMLAELGPRPKAAKRTKRKAAKQQLLAEPSPQLQKNEHA